MEQEIPMLVRIDLINGRLFYLAMSRHMLWKDLYFKSRLISIEEG